MRVFNRDGFLKLPVGTIYSKGKPWLFDGISVKGDTLPAIRDWVYLGLEWIDQPDYGTDFDRLDEMLRTGDSHPMQTAFGRDGAYDQDEIFLVWEHADLLKLRSLVDDAIAVA